MNICTNERYTQVVSVSSQISQVIDNLRVLFMLANKSSVLKASVAIALFNHNGLLNASETFRSLSIENGDMIGILPVHFLRPSHLVHVSRL